MDLPKPNPEVKRSCLTPPPLDPSDSSLEERIREVRGAIGKQPLSVSKLFLIPNIQFTQQMTFQEEILMLGDGSPLVKKTSNID